MAQDSITGKGGGITVAGSQLTITKWNSKSAKDYGDSTDSSNYDVAGDQLWASQLPGKQNQVITFEGNWSRASTPSGLVAILKSNPTVPATLMIDRSTPFCSGMYDLSDVELDLNVTDASPVSFTGTLKSNGKITYS